MNKISYQEKIEKLLDHYRFSTKLAEALKVHRMSIPNWRDGKVEISRENRLKIDLLYAEHCIVPSLKKAEVDAYARKLESEDHSFFLRSIDIAAEVSRKNAFGSLEVEVSDMDEAVFYRVVEGDYIEKDIDKRAFLEMNNLAFLTRRIFADTVEGRIAHIDSETIRKWHFGLMLGIRNDAGRYSTKMRIIPDTRITLTAPEDIPEEMEYWTDKYSSVKSICDIARAHEHFELIHPFGDGNGRTGRLIMLHQFLKLGLLPPLIDGYNKAFYYVALEKAQTEGNIVALKYFLILAVERTKEQLGVSTDRAGRERVF